MDPRLRLGHTLETLETMLSDLAPVLAAYRDSLMASGFTREEALRLVRDAQRKMFGARETDDVDE